MPLATIRFRFSQRFPFPARAAYDWSVDFQPDDVERLGKKGRRRIERLNEDTFLLTDTFHAEDGGRVVKQRLVCLYPERLSWTNTHTKGPSKHSQFLYEIVPEGENACRLDFTGRQLVSVDAIDSRRRSELARSIRREDSATWKLLARAMAADLEAPSAKCAPRRR
jgi:hypothetical protein